MNFRKLLMKKQSLSPLAFGLVFGVPDWKRQMAVWLNTQLHHTGPIGKGILAREPEVPSAASASAR